MKKRTVYFTYIVRCADGTFYTGMTWNILQRMKQHNGELAGGAKYTKIRRPVILQYFEEHETYKLAAQRENQLKKYSHKKKMMLCINKD